MNNTDKISGREFWIDAREDQDFFIYNVVRGVCNYNFIGAIHVITYSAFEQALARIAELEQKEKIMREALEQIHREVQSMYLDQKSLLQSKYDIARAALEKIKEIEK